MFHLSIDIYILYVYQVLQCHLIFVMLTQWLEEEFLPYLESWEKSVHERDGFSAKEKEMMLMPKETRLGITETGISKYLWFKLLSSI